LAKENEAIAEEKRLEKERARQEKEQEKLAKEKEKADKKRASDEAKRAKRDIRAAARVSQKIDTDRVSPKFGAKPRVIAAAVALVALLAIGSALLRSPNNGDSQESQSVDKVPTFTWSALISGESKAQTGDGVTFQIFVCDQNVIASSLEVKNISARAESAGPLSTKVIKGDQRCGKAFDTILVSGKEPELAGSVNYYVAGKTSSNFDFRYDFSVTVLPN
jgi:hypothetical protein